MKLSVLITYHNEGAWLNECLLSIVPQLGDQDEVIVYDDASERAASGFTIPDARVRIIRGKQNIGPARARNELFAAGTGELVHFHDADDCFHPDWRATVLASFSDEVDVVFTDVQSFDAAGGAWHHVMDIGRLERSGDLLDFSLRGGVLVPAGTYRRAAIDRIGGYRAEMWQSEDYDFHIRLALSKPRFRVIAKDLVLIRRHDNQRSLLTREVWASAIDALEYLEPKFPQRVHEGVAHAATRAGSALFAVGARGDAARAFRLAERFGGPRYERALMQNLTRVVGAMPAERLASLYRRIIPNALRSHVQRSSL
jgi:glycosyltransferase involved in cell wall biosynthesis